MPPHPLTTGLLKKTQVSRILSKQARIAEFKASGLSRLDFAKARGICPVGLWRDLKKAVKDDPMEFLDQRSVRSGPRSRIDDHAIGWALLYLERHKCTVVAVHEEITRVGRKYGWRVPSYDRLCAIFREMPQDLRTMLREGAREVFEQHSIVARREESVLNSLWQCDFTPIPVWTRSPVSGQMFQPNLVSFIECKSRVAMSALIFKDPIDTAAILIALKSAAMVKSRPDYPFYGLPRTLQTDNHQVFKSDDFLEAIYRLNITLIHSPVECSSANGKVERYFRTLKTQLCRTLDGYAGRHRGLERAKKNYIPYPLLQSLVDRFLVKNVTSVHSELGKTPWEAWHEALETAVGLEDRDNDIISAVQVRRDVTVMRDGVEVVPGGILYTAPELAGLVDQKITIRIPPEGPQETVEAYYQNKFLALLQKQGSHGLADALQAARVGRAADLHRIAAELGNLGHKLLTGSPQLPIIKDPAEDSSPVQSVDKDLPYDKRGKDSVPDFTEEES